VLESCDYIIISEYFIQICYTGTISEWIYLAFLDIDVFVNLVFNLVMNFFLLEICLTHQDIVTNKPVIVLKNEKLLS